MRRCSHKQTYMPNVIYLICFFIKLNSSKLRRLRRTIHKLFESIHMMNFHKMILCNMILHKYSWVYIIVRKGVHGKIDRNDIFIIEFILFICIGPGDPEWLYGSNQRPKTILAGFQNRNLNFMVVVLSSTCRNIVLRIDRFF